MSIDELFNSFLSLDADQQNEFLDRAFAVRHALPFDSEWLDEIQRRSAEVDAGRAELQDWQDVRQEMHRKHFPHV